MNPDYYRSRRQFPGQTAAGFGIMATADLLGHKLHAAERSPNVSPVALGGTHFAPKAKRVIYLFLSGGPVILICSTTSLC